MIDAVAYCVTDFIPSVWWSAVIGFAIGCVFMWLVFLRGSPAL